jgi:hypothetical protein
MYRGGATECVMAGAFAKTGMFGGWRPDLAALALLARLGRQLQDDRALRELARWFEEAGIPRDLRVPRTRAICLVVIMPPIRSLLVTRSLLRSFFSIRSSAWPSLSDLSMVTGCVIMSFTCITSTSQPL